MVAVDVVVAVAVDVFLTGLLVVALPVIVFMAEVGAMDVTVSVATVEETFLGCLAHLFLRGGISSSSLS